jgi:lipopolysaccharide biosynthesis protein
LTGEICLFVTFSNQPGLKNHVANHIEQLLSAGVQVVLVVNTPNPQIPLAIETPLANKLTGIYARANAGFDFAAWAHLLHLMPDTSGWKRLFLINDSLVGPLDEEAFHKLILRIRNSDSDFLGLTQNLDPLWHLQSFFLVFNASALKHPFFSRYFERIVSLTSKESVINVYETKFTQALVDNGLRYEVLFPLKPGLPHFLNSTIKLWEQLLDAGFPYVKTSVVRELGNTPRLLKRVPARFLDA